MRLQCLAVLSLMVSSCGADTPVYGITGCDFRKGSVNGPEARCQERTMIVPDFFRLGCAAAGGEQLPGACPREGVIAGCRLSGSNPAQVATDWYYPTLADGTPSDRETPEKVAEVCQRDGTLVQP